ncbi:hypothetical protein JCM11491_005242 [Sporobolomyces phaffii]
MSATLSTTPTLPTELIDEILRSNVLSNQDLARCCLTSRQFLPAARLSLYDHVQIETGFRFCDPEDAEKLTEYVRFIGASGRLFETLEASPLLGQYTASISFSFGEGGMLPDWIDFLDPETDTVEPRLQSIQSIFDSVLRLTPNAHQIAFNATWLCNMHAGYDLHGVDKVEVYEVSGYDVPDLRIPSQVRALKLRIRSDSRNSVVWPYGASLTALDIDIKVDGNGTDGRVRVFVPNLRILRCPPRFIIDNPSLPDVEHLLLHITDRDDADYLQHASDLYRLSHLRTVRFLSLELSQLSHYIVDAIELTLASLRPDQRPTIHFPRLVPFDLLSKMLELGTLPAHRIQLPSIVSDTDPSDASQLQQLCAAQGVELEWVPSGPIDIFKIKLEEP